MDLLRGGATEEGIKCGKPHPGSCISLQETKDPYQNSLSGTPRTFNNCGKASADQLPTDPSRAPLTLPEYFPPDHYRLGLGGASRQTQPLFPSGLSRSASPPPPAASWRR